MVSMDFHVWSEHQKFLFPLHLLLRSMYWTASIWDLNQSIGNSKIHIVFTETSSFAKRFAWDICLEKGWIYSSVLK